MEAEWRTYTSIRHTIIDSGDVACSVQSHYLNSCWLTVDFIRPAILYWPQWVNSLAPQGRRNDITSVFSNPFYELIFGALSLLVSGECHRTPLMIRQHYLSPCWVDPDLCHHLASLATGSLRQWANNTDIICKQINEKNGKDSETFKLVRITLTSHFGLRAGRRWACKTITFC